MSDLREGLAKAMFEHEFPKLKWHEITEGSRLQWIDNADAALAFLRQHDGYAELRERLRVAEGALDDGRDYVGSALTCYNRDGKLCQLCLDRLELFSLGDAELAKEQP